MNELEDALERVRQFYQPSCRENVHPIWDKTIGNQKLAVAAFRNPETGTDCSDFFVLVYENSNLKHFHLQDARSRALTFTEDFKQLEPPCESIEKRSPEAQMYFHLARVFRNASPIFPLPTDNPTIKVRWETSPYCKFQKYPAKYAVQSVLSELLQAGNRARALTKDKEDPRRKFVDALYEELNNFVFKEFYPNHPEEKAETSHLIGATLVQQGRLTNKDSDKNYELQNRALLFLATRYINTMLIGVEGEKNE